jgi:hypothetical protein
MVATDAIKHALASGEPRRMAAWRGPSRLVIAIAFATTEDVSIQPATMRGDPCSLPPPLRTARTLVTLSNELSNTLRAR